MYPKLFVFLAVLALSTVFGCTPVPEEEPKTDRRAATGFSAIDTNRFWESRTGHAVVAHDGHVWLLGGTGNGELVRNDIRRFSTGSRWEDVADFAPWQERTGHRALSFHDAIWLFPDLGEYDIWTSPDGFNWIHAAEFPYESREYYGAVVFDGAMWLLGGNGPFGPMNDVYRSTDGETWEVVAESSPWSRRSGHCAVVFKDRIWIIGGTDASGDLLDDVWSSADGVAWENHSATVPWDARTLASAIAFDDALWLISGRNVDGEGIDETWYSMDGTEWTQAYSNSGCPMGPGYDRQVVTLDDRIYVVGGYEEDTQVYSSSATVCDYRRTSQYEVPSGNELEVYFETSRELIEPPAVTFAGKAMDHVRTTHPDASELTRYTYQSTVPVEDIDGYHSYTVFLAGFDESYRNVYYERMVYLRIDNTPPEVQILPPSTTTVYQPPHTLPVQFGFAFEEDIDFEFEEQPVELIRTGTAMADTEMWYLGDGLGAVGLTNISGTGTLAIRLPAGIVDDYAGNESLATPPSVAVSVGLPAPDCVVPAEAKQYMPIGSSLIRSFPQGMRYVPGEPLAVDIEFEVLENPSTPRGGVVTFRERVPQGWSIESISSSSAYFSPHDSTDGSDLYVGWINPPTGSVSLQYVALPPVDSSDLAHIHGTLSVSGSAADFYDVKSTSSFLCPFESYESEGEGEGQFGVEGEYDVEGELEGEETLEGEYAVEGEGEGSPEGELACNASFDWPVIDPNPAVRFTRSFPGGGFYTPDTPVEVRIDIENLDGATLKALALEENYSNAWTFAGLGEGALPVLSPGIGEDSIMEFAWISPPTMPAYFTYWVLPSQEAAGIEEMFGQVFYRFDGPEGRTNIETSSLCPLIDDGTPPRSRADISVPGYTPGELLWVRTDYTLIDETLVGSIDRIEFQDDRLQTVRFAQFGIVDTEGPWVGEYHHIVQVPVETTGPLGFREIVVPRRARFGNLAVDFASARSTIRATPPQFDVTFSVPEGTTYESGVPVEVTCTLEKLTEVTPDRVVINMILPVGWQIDDVDFLATTPRLRFGLYGKGAFIRFNWETVPSFPATFTFSLLPDAYHQTPEQVVLGEVVAEYDGIEERSIPESLVLLPE